jgi:hypothetical protein
MCKALNYNCDGGPHGCDGDQVRRLPLSGDSAVIVCREHYRQEIRFRRDANRELAGADQYDLPEWRELEVYRPE